MSIDVTPGSTRPLTDRVAEEIRVVMTRKRITGARLARELGVSAAWVSYRLTGQQPIDLNDLERIAGVLGVEVVDLLPARGGRGHRSSGVTDGYHTATQTATRAPASTVRAVRCRPDVSTRTSGQIRTSRIH